MAQRIQTEKQETYEERKRRIMQTNHFNLKTSHEALRDYPKYEIKRDDVVLECSLWIPIEIFKKMMHLADLTEEGYTRYIVSAITNRVEQDMTNHEELGRLLEKRITEDILDLSSFSPAGREHILQRAKATGDSIKDLVEEERRRWGL
jgi:hypothetical protein